MRTLRETIFRVLMEMEENPPSKEQEEDLARAFFSGPPDLQWEVFLRILRRANEVSQLVRDLHEVEKKLEALQDSPGVQGMLVGHFNGTAPERAVVALANNERVEVSLHPNLDRSRLCIGATIVLSEDRRVGVGVRETLPGGELAEVEETRGEQIVVKSRNVLAVVSRAAQLNDTWVEPGDLVRVDRGLAFEKVRLTQKLKQGAVVEQAPKTTFADIAGLDAQIQELRELIELPLLHPELFRRLRIPNERGLVLDGPPGCGKTLIGEAIANSLANLDGGNKAAFLQIKGAEIFSKWVGESEQNVREIFAKARELSRAGKAVVVFWDEFESVARQRSASPSSMVVGTVVGTLLTELNGFSEQKTPPRVLVVVATNKPDLIDAALLRPGRLSAKVTIPRPSRAAAEKVLHLYLKPEMMHPDHNTAECLEEAIAGTLGTIYGMEAQLGTLVLRDGKREPFFHRSAVSGALLHRIVVSAARRACLRQLDLGREDGITRRDLLAVVEKEFSSLTRIIKPHNIHDHLSLGHDKDVAAIEPVTSHRRPHGLLRH